LVTNSKLKTPLNFFADGGLQLTSTEQDLPGNNDVKRSQLSKIAGSTPNGAAFTENEEISALSVCEMLVILTFTNVRCPITALLILTGSGLKSSLGQPFFANAVPAGPSSPSSSTTTIAVRFARVIAFPQHQQPGA
jgi:hypothetical protein